MMAKYADEGANTADSPDGRRQDNKTKTLTMISNLLKIGLALAIIIIVATHLTNHTGANGRHYTCLLGATHYSLCGYAWAVAGLSLLASLLLATLACLTCGLCRFMLGELAISIFGLLWWIAAAIVLTYYSHQADGRGYPRAHWRHSIFAMAWAEVFLFFLMSLVYMLAGKKHRNDSGPMAPKNHMDANNHTSSANVYDQEQAIPATYVQQPQQHQGGNVAMQQTTVPVYVVPAVPGVLAAQ